MKTIIIFALSAVMSCGQSVSDIQMQRSSMQINVTTLQSRKANDATWKTNYGSYDKDTYRSRAIDIELTNGGKVKESFFLKTYWVGMASGSKWRLVLAHETQALEVEPTKAVHITSSSGDVVESDLRLRAIGTRNQSGSRIEGWFVVLCTADGKYLRTKASSHELDAISRDPSAIRRILFAGGYDVNGNKIKTSLPSR